MSDIRREESRQPLSARVGSRSLNRTPTPVANATHDSRLTPTSRRCRRQSPDLPTAWRGHSSATSWRRRDGRDDVAPEGGLLGRRDKWPPCVEVGGGWLQVGPLRPGVRQISDPAQLWPDAGDGPDTWRRANPRIPARSALADTRPLHWLSKARPWSAPA
jgi:hypothetical protein